MQYTAVLADMGETNRDISKDIIGKCDEDSWEYADDSEEEEGWEYKLGLSCAKLRLMLACLLRLS